MTTSIVEQLAALQIMDSARLIVEYRRLFDEEPRCKNKVWLFRNCAWRVQELVHGGLSQPARDRLSKLMAKTTIPGVDGTSHAASTRPHDPSAPPIGTTLVRDWHGKQIRVTATADGYEFNGRTFRSLSAIAQHVTGAKWNGRLWFGLAPARARR